MWSAVRELGKSGLPVHEGIVEAFDLRTGNGFIKAGGIDGLVFFNFTAIPGEGYRTIKSGNKVKFELVETHTGLSANNIQRQDD